MKSAMPVASQLPGKGPLIRMMPRTCMLIENMVMMVIMSAYYIPINDTTFELSVIWPSDTTN